MIRNRKNRLNHHHKISLNFNGEKDYYEFEDNYISKWDKYLFSEDAERFEIVDVVEIDYGPRKRSFVKIKEGELDINKVYYVKLDKSDLRKLKIQIREKRLDKLLK